MRLCPRQGRLGIRIASIDYSTGDGILEKADKINYFIAYELELSFMTKLASIVYEF
jgi:hypothetical protein